MATTPRARSASSRLASLFSTPRSLKEPVACMFSCFTNRVAPVRSESRWQGTKGVASPWPWIVAAARRTSSSVTASSGADAGGPSDRRREDIAGPPLERAQPLRHPRRVIGEDPVGAGPLERDQALHHGALPVDPAVLGRGLHHRVLARHLVGEG